MLRTLKCLFMSFIKIFIHSSEISSVLFDLNQWQLKINIALELCWNEPWHSLQN